MKNDGHSRESKKPSSKALDHPLNYSKEPLFEIYVTFVPKHHFLFRITRILFHFIFLLSRHSTSYTQVRRIIVQFYDGNQRGTTTEMIFFPLFHSFGVTKWLLTHLTQSYLVGILKGGTLSSNELVKLIKHQTLIKVKYSLSVSKIYSHKSHFREYFCAF